MTRILRKRKRERKWKSQYEFKRLLKNKLEDSLNNLEKKTQY